MDAAALKAQQAPLKNDYREAPDKALITLRARGSIDDQAIACKVETGRAVAIAGLHPATGGSGMELCSGDMLLEALVACAGVTLKAVATALEFKLDGATVLAEGDLDFRGTLGVAKDAPVGFVKGFTHLIWLERWHIRRACKLGVSTRQPWSTDPVLVVAIPATELRSDEGKRRKREGWVVVFLQICLAYERLADGEDGIDQAGIDDVGGGAMLATRESVSWMMRAAAPRARAVRLNRREANSIRVSTRARASRLSTERTVRCESADDREG